MKEQEYLTPIVDEVTFYAQGIHRPWGLSDDFRVQHSYPAFNRPMSAEEGAAALATLQANPVLAGKDGGPLMWQLRGNPWFQQGTSGYHFGDVDIDKQPDHPENPGIQPHNVSSSFGNVIPISLGRRRISGTIIVASEAVPRLEGTYVYDKVYQVPVYEDKADLAYKIIMPVHDFYDEDVFSDEPFALGDDEEVKRKTHTVRITQDGEPDNWVDVEVVDEVLFGTINGTTRTTKYKNE